MKTLLCIFGILFCFVPFKAQQTPYSVFSIGYEYVNRSYGSLGYSLYLVSQNDNVLSLSANVYMGSAQKKFLAIPEGEIGYTFSGKDHSPYKDVNASFYQLALGVTPYAIRPKIGISVVNLFNFYAGYSFEFNKNKYANMQGFIFGVKFHTPFQIF